MAQHEDFSIRGGGDARQLRRDALRVLAAMRRGEAVILTGDPRYLRKLAARVRASGVGSVTLGDTPDTGGGEQLTTTMLVAEPDEALPVIETLDDAAAMLEELPKGRLVRPGLRDL